MVIDFTPEGQVQALHQDAFPLWFLGRMEVTRASTIAFNEESQRWDIHLHLPGGAKWSCPELTGIDGYELARLVEVTWLDQLRLLDLPCDSAEAINRLKSIRVACGA